MNEQLNKIQCELNAPKNLYNSFGNYKYRNVEGIFEGLKPLLKKTKTTVILSDEVVEVGGWVYVKATATFSDGKNSISVSAFAREPESKKGMDSAQITGSCSSYARKYALNGLFAIDDTKDSDYNADDSPPPQFDTWEDKRKTLYGGSGKYKGSKWLDIPQGYILWLIHEFPSTEWGDKPAGIKKIEQATEERQYRIDNKLWSMAEEEEYLQ